MYLNLKKLHLNINNQEHPYFLVTPSIIPLLTSISALFFVTEVINYFYFFSDTDIMVLSFLALNLILAEWFYNVALESDFQTKSTKLNNQVSFLIFILTEVMFFFSLFWVFFHGSLAPSIVFNCIWPPKGINLISSFGTPLLGTWILWISSIHALHCKNLILSNFINNWSQALYNFRVVLTLAVLFTVCQLTEFYSATFSFREGLYGSIFYLLTGFHGIHVIIGSIFLIICYIRYYLTLCRALGELATTDKLLLLSFFGILKINSYISTLKDNSVLKGKLTINFLLELRKFYYIEVLEMKIKSIKYLHIKPYYARLQSTLIFLGKLWVKPLFKEPEGSGIKASTHFRSYILQLDRKKRWEPYHFSGLESSVYYWQFVDIVWILVWILVYIWGNESFLFAINLELKSF